MHEERIITKIGICRTKYRRTCEPMVRKSTTEEEMHLDG
jgi:hypothetical protein